MVRANPDVTPRNVSFQSHDDGQFTLSTQLIHPKFCVLLTGSLENSLKMQCVVPFENVSHLPQFIKRHLNFQW